MASSSSISKIHVASSTGLSLNDRFTAIATQPAAVQNHRRSRSRSRSRGRDMQKVNPATSMANRRLLQQLARRHKMNAAMKLKRRSMRTIGAAASNNGARALKRGSVQAFRVGPNGRAIKANSMARTATMKADYVLNRNNRPLRRANSISNRVGRPGMGGGAAERVAKRRLERLAGDGGGRIQRYSGRQGRSRSRSRSRTRLPRENNIANGANVQRARSRSRSRGRVLAGANKIPRVPIKARLGLRPGAPGAAPHGRRNERNRGANMAQRGVVDGRVEKRRRPNGIGGNAEQRGRSRSRVRANVNENGRSRSRQRRGSVGQVKQQQQQQQRQNGRQVGRSRSRQRQPQSQMQLQQQFQRQRQQQPQRNVQRRQRNGKFTQKQMVNNKANGNNNNNNNRPVVQRRGRSRSRANRNNGGKNLGNNNKNMKQNPVKKEDLDNELDQYMSTTKTDGELDYLLKN